MCDICVCCLLCGGTLVARCQALSMSPTPAVCVVRNGLHFVSCTKACCTAEEACLSAAYGSSVKGDTGHKSSGCFLHHAELSLQYHQSGLSAQHVEFEVCPLCKGIPSSKLTSSCVISSYTLGRITVSRLGCSCHCQAIKLGQAQGT